MEQTAQETLAQIVAKETWTNEDQKALVGFLTSDRNGLEKLRAATAEMESANPQARGAAALKIGMARYTLCRFQEALAALGEATDNKDRRWTAALCWKQLRRFDKAAEELDRARDAGFDAQAVEIETIEVQALAGNLDAAAKALGKAANRLGHRADFFYLSGLIEDLRGNVEHAVDFYEKARSADPNHAAATFRLAYALDLHGDEGQAIELYKECLSRPPVHAGAILNLAVLYEDAGKYDHSAVCLRRLLSFHPGHPRALLFMKDVEASQTMYFDEEQAKRMAKRSAVMDIPVTDFELSVRARNCLKKMNIRTLGDLVRTTEQQLLAYKNFGETSLKEIKDMLSAKGLRLGQASEETPDLLAAIGLPIAAPEAGAPSQSDGAMAIPVDQLDFSVRARKAMEGLKVRTLGDLANLTEADLLACRNFGTTSLNEIRQRLTEHGLTLKES